MPGLLGLLLSLCHVTRNLPDVVAAELEARAFRVPCHGLQLRGVACVCQRRLPATDFGPKLARPSTSPRMLMGSWGLCPRSIPNL